jgi:membrane protease YdiL (CAAX protease family)
MYFVLAFIFTWLILSPGVASTLGLLDFQIDGFVVTILAGLGPLLAAIVVTSATEGRTGVRKIFESMFNWRVKFRWWAASVLLLVGLFVIVAALALLMGNGINLAGGSVVVLILLLLLASFGEEPGWRGFALPRLQEKHSPLKATLILTLFWWLWHIPTYWTLPQAVNSMQEFGFATAFGTQLVVLLVLGILCAWVYNGSGGSVLMPVLLHASFNFWSMSFGQDVATFLLPLFLVTAIVVGFATRWKLGTGTTAENENGS